VVDTIKLIIGLGNPGKEYENTRHNIGFMFIDAVLIHLGMKLKKDKNLLCEIGQANVNGEKMLFIKPQTYMNLSGQSVIKVMSFYKIDIEDIIVIYDDLDLDVGKMKIKPGGSSGGHKGIQSIIDVLHTNNIKRIRIGISNNKLIPTVDYVLGKFSNEEKKAIDLFLNEGYDIITDLADKSFDYVMNKYN